MTYFYNICEKFNKNIEMNLVAGQFWMAHFPTILDGTHPPFFPPSPEGGTEYVVVFGRFKRPKTTVANGPSPTLGEGLGWGKNPDS